MSTDIDLEAVEQILNEEVTFFTDRDNASQVYVEYPLPSGARCFSAVEDSRFISYVDYRYRRLTQEWLCPAEVFEFVEAKKNDAIYLQSNPVTINRRVTGTLASTIVYFLSNDKWESVTVTPSGWSVGQAVAEKFIKLPTDLPQVIPTGGGNLLKLLRPFINLNRDDYILFVTFLVQGSSRSSNHFAAIISSSKGTGKSTLSRVVRTLIDPSSADVPLAPTNAGDLLNLLANTYLAVFDNTAPLKAIFSDDLCASVTGTKNVKRQLYTDNKQVVQTIHNLIVINGIDIVPRRSDLADRSLLFELRPIPPSKRQTEETFWRNFNAKKPEILGAIFDTLVKAMQILPTLNFTWLDRMADAYKEMTAIAVALGVKQDEFERIFRQNKNNLQTAYNQSSPLVEIVLDFMRNKTRIDRPASKLYSELRDSIVGSSKFFPDSPSALSRKLNEERDALEAAGYRFERKRVGDLNHIVISRIPQNQRTKEQRDHQQRKALPSGDNASGMD